MLKMKTIILDFDGTIGDTQRIIVGTMQRTLEELHLPPRTREQCASRIGLPLKETFTTLINMDDGMGERCAQTYTRLFMEANRPGAVPVFPHVVDTIKALHACGHTLTIASSRRRASLVAFIEEMNLQEYITYIISADGIARAKPAPDMVLKTLAETRTDARDALVVGDTEFDIIMGRDAGVKTVGVTYGNGRREELAAAGADYLIDDFGELKKIVRD